ncbi:EF-hand calcium-binding domain-containing protein 1 [Nephila pilipes]|uniref:EF-hand calcium-binding domain-containing protein 1 n=1 Tax=Nephila pilipes TaxID=299642 RepID=A0A8X6U693_NEPPI|nr:EF-hand calcium-binding domain-containing protein 1 [Nephila pilipes]
MEGKNDKLVRKEGGLTKLGEKHLIDKLSNEVGFTHRELRRIMNIYKRYLKDLWYMDEPVFSEVLHNTFGFKDDFFMKRLFFVADLDKDRKINMEEFIRVVAIMLRGTILEKIRLCFSCFDLDDSQELTREGVTDLLLEAINEPPTKDSTADGLRDLVELIFSKMDEDEDGCISYEEFKKECLRDWTVMEIFGQCLPDHRHRAAFLVLLESDQDVTVEQSV